MIACTLSHTDAPRTETRLPDAWGALVIVVLSLALWAVIAASAVAVAELVW